MNTIRLEVVRLVNFKDAKLQWERIARLNHPSHPRHPWLISYDSSQAWHRAQRRVPTTLAAARRRVPATLIAHRLRQERYFCVVVRRGALEGYIVSPCAWREISIYRRACSFVLYYGGEKLSLAFDLSLFPAHYSIMQVLASGTDY